MNILQQRMNISDERLAEEFDCGIPFCTDPICSMSRELRDYRKAVKAYLDAVDARNRWLNEDGNSPYTHAPLIPTVANLRALITGTET